MTVRLFRNVSLVTPVDHGKPSAGERQRDVVRHSPGAMLVADGLIVAAGAERDVLTRAREFRVDMEVDGGGAAASPASWTRTRTRASRRRGKASFPSSVRRAVP